MEEGLCWVRLGLEITDSTIHGNHAGNSDFGIGGSGGGIYNRYLLTVRSSTIYGNYAGDSGGAILRTKAVTAEEL